jgi:hypothetical protein
MINKLKHIIKNIKTFFYKLVVGHWKKKVGHKFNLIGHMMNHSRQYLIIASIFIFVGITLMYFSNHYTPKLDTITLINNETGEISYKPNYQIEFSGYLLNIAGQSLVSVGVGIYVLILISENLTKQDRKNFEDRIEKFQKQTAKNAMLSVFDTLIDNNFYDIIRKDVIGLNLIRRNVHWDYQISKISGGIELKRSVKYDLFNLTSKELSDIVKSSIGSNKHTSITNVEVYVGTNKLELSQTAEKNSFKLYEGYVKISPGENKTIKINITQHFNSDYVYETHTVNHPMTDLTININKPKDMTFEISDNMSSSLLLENETEQIIRYKTSGAIYKGQGIEFYCE